MTILLSPQGLQREILAPTTKRRFPFRSAHAVLWSLADYIVIRYNQSMKSDTPDGVSIAQLRTLAEFRYRLRMFLQFSESAAQKLGLQPQQHQLLLQIAGAAEGTATTVGFAAERLGLRHNTAVELSNRSAEAGLIRRKQGDQDRRRVLLELTAKGKRLLDSLSLEHERELDELAPQLIHTLTELKALSSKPGKRVRQAHHES
jgi:DNA-binding MarR family transcriptional regulator